jgi:endonuclease/exonuclease/phosphatase family metal-dependent hydrolase
MRPRRMLVIAAVACALVVGAVVGARVLGAASPATSPGANIVLLQFNMCGHACRDPSPDKVAGVVDLLADVHPAAASLNEVCRSQLDGIVAGTAGRGWAMHAQFIVTQPDECAGGADYGNALLTRSPPTSTDRLTYGAQVGGDPEHRGLLCVTTSLGDRPTHICTTHIVDALHDPLGDVRRKQIALAARRVATYRGPVVLMGDFNTRPPDAAMGDLYTSRHGNGGLGEFDEVGQASGTCRCGEPTHSSGAKYDYIFVTDRDFDVIHGSVRSSRFSDHKALIGQVTKRG